MIVAKAVRVLLRIVGCLQKEYKTKKFTLDGRLVGDLGEVLCVNNYQLRLFKNIKPKYDGETKDGRPVQIKTTMKETLCFPHASAPKLYLGIKINLDGSFEEIFNGPGELIRKTIKHRKAPKNGLHNISINTLRRLSATVKSADRIKRRNKPTGFSTST